LVGWSDGQIVAKQLDGSRIEMPLSMGFSLRQGHTVFNKLSSTKLQFCSVVFFLIFAPMGRV